MNPLGMKPLLRFILLFLILVPATLFAQEKYTISGYVKDNATGESLPGTNVYVKELMKGTTTNVYGFYSITLESGDYNLVISFVGYQDIEIPVSLTQDLRENVSMKMKGITGKEVEIIAERTDENTDGTQMGKVELEMDKIKTLPAFMGEVDVLKTIQFLPGVQSAGEGNSGFYVRGGGPDQNLILLDEAVVYNASHLFGFFSVFNADAIKNIELTKGGMPANYGGRLASVLDITMKEGNSRRIQGDGGIGVISSRLTLQGPIKEDTSSFIISGRRTYIDILTKPFIPKDSPFAGSGYFFFDLNAKVNYKLSDKDRLFLSGYFGRDVFSYFNADADFLIRIPWGNATGSLRWNHLFSDRLFMNATAIFSDYNFAFEATQSQFDFKLFSGIRDGNFKLDFSYYPNIRHNIKFGTNYTYHIFTPNNATARSGDVEFDTGEISRIYAHEAAGYVMDEFDVNDKLRINAGVRMSYFAHVGPFDRFVKNQNFQTVDTLSYGAGERVADYFGFEPRIATRYKLSDVASIKAAFTQNYQYIHLASLSAVSLPTDIWLPSSDRVKPQFGRQYNIGYFRNFKENLWETSIEIYYKTMDNLVEYREGAVPENDVGDNPDSQLVFGNGYSYGLELFLKKRYGSTTGWIGYTWSKTERQFDDINLGEWFAAKYDRRHDVSIIVTHELNDKWTFGGAFVYATGNTITLPISRYIIEGNIVDEYGPRNGNRMPAYHRADVSATYTGAKTRFVKDEETGEMKEVPRKFFSSWSFSIYNLYNRANPYFIYFDNEGDLQAGNLEITAKQVSLFPILPSVTWNFKF